MLVFRIALQQYAQDLSNTDGLYTDGRWHRQGSRILYTAQSKSLATLEKLFHLSRRDFALEHRCVSLQLPEDSLQLFPEHQLPQHWNSRRGPEALKELGTQWLRQQTSLALRLPSVLVRGEYNILINPLHPRMPELQLV